MKNFNTLKITKYDTHVLLITLNRPAFRNAINSEMMLELRNLWQSFYINSEDLRCIILTGAEKSFCAGADLKERNNITVSVWQQQHAILEQAILAMIDCPIPIISAINGSAYGGGLELVLASDFAYAVPEATFALPEAKLGFMPGALGTQTLPRAIGLRKAKEMCLSAKSFTAAEAYQWGLINKICSHETLLQEALETAKKIASNAPLAVQQIKKAINISQQTDIKSGYAFELEAYNRLLPTQDREEGIKAFNEKRTAVFKGA